MGKFSEAKEVKVKLTEDQEIKIESIDSYDIRYYISHGENATQSKTNKLADGHAYHSSGDTIIVHNHDSIYQ